MCHGDFFHSALIVVYCRDLAIFWNTQIDDDCFCSTRLEKVATKLCDPLTRTSSVHWGEKICHNMEHIKARDHNYLHEFSAFESAAEALKRLESMRNLASWASVKLYSVTFSNLHTGHMVFVCLVRNTAGCSTGIM